MYSFIFNVVNFDILHSSLEAIFKKYYNTNDK
jgi:hypothetical protein